MLNADNEHVQRGALLFDKLNPGWFEYIDTEILDMGDPEKCVVGQSHDGEYTVPLFNIYGVDPDVNVDGGAAYYGFDVAWDGTVYEDLTRAWIAEIEARRNERIGGK